MKRTWFRKGFLMSLVFFLAFGSFSCGQPKSGGDKDGAKAKDVSIGSFKIKDTQYNVFELQDGKVVLPASVSSFTKDDVKEVKAKDGKKTVDLEVDSITPATVTPTEEGVEFTITTKATKDYKASSKKLKAVKGKNEVNKYKVTYATDPANKGNITPSLSSGAFPADAMVPEGETVIFDFAPTDSDYEAEPLEWVGATVDATNKNRATAVISATTHVVAKLKLKNPGGGGTDNITVKFSVEGVGKLEMRADGNDYVHTQAEASSGISIPKGTKVSFTATPGNGQRVAAWEGVDGAKEQNNVEVLDPQADLTVKVTFGSIPQRINLKLKTITVDDKKVDPDTNDQSYKFQAESNVEKVNKIEVKFENEDATTPPVVTFSPALPVDLDVNEQTIFINVARNDKYERWQGSITVSKKGDNGKTTLQLQSISVDDTSVSATSDEYDYVATDANKTRIEKIEPKFSNEVSGKKPVVRIIPALPILLTTEKQEVTILVVGDDTYNVFSKKITVSKQAGGSDGNITVKFSVEKVDGHAHGFLEMRYQGGAKTYKDSDAEATSGISVPKGAKISFSATPETGYRVLMWTGITGGEKKKDVYIDNPTQDIEVKVKFEKEPVRKTLEIQSITVDGKAADYDKDDNAWSFVAEANVETVTRITVKFKDTTLVSGQDPQVVFSPALPYTLTTTGGQVHIDVAENDYYNRFSGSIRLSKKS